MHLIQQQDADAFLGDPFVTVSDLFEEPKLPHAPTFSEIENEFEATAVQKDIVGEAIQWLTSELRLPSYTANLQNIVNAWNTLAAYHTSLRSHFHVHQKSGRLVVRVVRRIEPITLADAPDRLSPGRLAHVTVAARKDGDLQLRLRFRRALIDATSLDHIKLDLFLLLCGIPPQEHIGFPNYTRFLRQTKDSTRSREFWASTLMGAVLRSAVLPREFLGQAIARPRTSVTTIVNPLSLGGDVAISRRTVLELLWAYVLSVHAEADEVVFGTVQRDASFFGSDSCIGCLDQTYLVRLHISGEDSIGDAAAALDAYHGSASAHGFLGLNAMRVHLPEQVPVEAVFNYTQSSNPQCIAPGLKQFPLILTICDAPGPELKLMLTYIADIAKADAEILLEQLVTAIQSVSVKPDLANTPLQDIDLVSAAERAVALTPPLFSGVADQPTLPDLIEAAVSRHPEQTAVQFEDKASLTYRELNALANGVAKTLKLRRGDIVPLLMDRSANLPVAMLAILKSGASYTIMGTDVPWERNARVVAECDAEVVLADKKQAHAEFPGTKTINIEELLDAAASHAIHNNDLAGHGIKRPRPGDLCYIIYTSGSTGKPKGTMITHLAAANGILHHTSIAHIPRTLLFYSPTASAAQRTFNSVLIHGGTMVLASKERLANDLAAVINDLHVDAVEMTPTALALLQPTDVPRLKQVTIAGERIPEPLVNQWAANDRLVVRNRYGSSECTQMSHGRRMRPRENPRVLGEPEDTTFACVLWPGTTHLVPVGVPGELCLAGPQLSAGYLKEPGLTGRVFVNNPFSEQLGELYKKMYRTGDKVRRLADGSIEMLGRIDWQAKINGTKVEPADVDRALGEHPDVAAVATVAAEVEEGRLALVTAIVLVKTRVWAQVLPSMRPFAVKALPPFMVPSFWLPLQQLPRSMNGKVDFHALRKAACELGTAGLSQFLVAQPQTRHDPGEDPVDDMERDIARIWATVLGLDKTLVRRHHSFLSLGGNSLLAIKAIGQLRKEGLVTDFANLMADKPLSEVALSVSEHKSSQVAPEVPPFSLLGADAANFVERVQTEFGLDLVEAYPATPLQEGVLATLNQEDGDPYTYRRVWDMEGLDIERLKDSFRRVLVARDIYKTGFVPRGRNLVQVVRNNLGLAWEEWHGSLEAYLDHDKKLFMPLSGPLFRTGLVANRYLVTTTHHALCDFWSHRILFQDVAAVYTGREVPSRPKFNNFIQYLLCQDLVPAREFWASYLQGSPRSIINYAPGEKTTITTRRITLNLKQTTLGSLVHTAWAVLLSHHLGSHDVTFATAVSGREVPLLGISDMDGPTLTTVPQRVKLDDQTKALGQLVKDVRAGFMQVAKYSQVGLRAALQAGQLDPGSIDTLVNVLVKNEDPEFVRDVFKPHGERPLWNSGPWTTLEVEELGKTSEPAEATIEVRLSGTAEARRLEFLADSFIKIATAILESPDQPLSSVHVLGDAEQKYLLNTLSNRGTLVVPSPQLLHARFEKQAELVPDAIAIDWEGVEQVSYGELDRHANQISQLLIQKGVLPGDVVALMLDKSIEAVAAILGVLKSGAAYTPLSAENPAERNSLIVSETKARAVIIHQQDADFALHHVPSSTVSIVINNEATKTTFLSTQPNTKPTVATTPSHLAYILYTSGSTGQPKGIQVPHGSAAAAVGSMITAERRQAGEWRTLQFANLVFDASVQDLFNTLSTGGTLCMAPTERLLSDLAGCVRAMRVRQAILTPTVAGLLRPGDVPGFETLIVGGEPLTRTVVEAWRPACRVLNVYGPTETCMVVSAKEVELGAGPTTSIGSIGRPFETVMAFVVDPAATGEQLAKVEDAGGFLRPYGTVGELCIAGPQVSAGYVDRPELTAASFVEMRALGGVSVYRTGDLVRWLPGGELECLGRKDNQVHLHGYRVELGEVEATVRASGLVRDTAVVVVEVNKKPQLAAFCIFNGDKDDTTTTTAVAAIQPPEQHQKVIHALKDCLEHSLPPYMVPYAVLPMVDFPKLPSRKVDRKALGRLAEKMDCVAIYPYVLSSTVGTEHTAVSVQTNDEAMLEALWAEILGVPEQSSIGREANFRSLGGDSISAISLASLARQRGFALSVPDILRHRTLKELATSMTELDTEIESSEIFEIPDSVKTLIDVRGLSCDRDVDYVYPSPPGQTEFLRQGARDKQMWVLNTVRRMPPSIDQDQWIVATEALAKANDILRTSWLQDPEDNKWFGVVLRNAKLSVQRFECQEEAEASNVVAKVYAYRFTFPEPFIRYVTITYPDRSWDLVIKMDHAVYDGTLLRIFDNCFGAIIRGTEIPKHVEFQDFAFAVSAANKSRSLRYWAAKLASTGAKTINAPLVTKATPWLKALAPCSTGLLRNPLPAARAEILEDLAASLGVSPSSIFQAAFQLWLWQTAGRGIQPVGFDYLVSGRSLPGNVAAALPGDPQTINGTVANFLPFVVSDVESTEPLSAYLTRTHDDFWAATDHGDVGLDDMYAAAGLNRAGAGNRVLFLFQPFNPASPVADNDPNGGLNFRWLVMAKSRVRMFQPYALVVEVAKAPGGVHNLTMFYDDTLFERSEVEAMAAEMAGMIEKVIAACRGKRPPTVGDLFTEY